MQEVKPFDFDEVSTIDVEPESLDPQTAKYLRHRIDGLIKHLVVRAQKAGAIYYETSPYSTKDKVFEVSNPLSIAASISPYVAYVANNYMRHFYGLDLGLFVFHKNVNKSLDEVQLDFTVNVKGHKHIPLILMFIVAAFEDKFYSTYSDQLIINQFGRILSIDDELESAA